METWRDIPGYEGYYQVSNSGRVRGVARVILRTDGKICTCKPRILKPYSNSGYHRIGLRKDLKTRQFLVHQLVLRAFVGEPPNGCEVNHLNGQRTDNRLANLEWVSRSANMYHAYDVLGRKPGHFGEAHHKAKLSVGKVLAIREAYASGEHSQAELGQQYSVSRQAIWRIVRRRSWRHI